MDRPQPERIASLDLIRGVAVLGILTVNIGGFAGPTAATLSPHVPMPGSFADEAAFASVFVFFEGKMRALFSMLFGASMLLFIERAEAAGRDGDGLQLKRLGWLTIFGLLHYFLFWWGDILFLYAVTGVIALLMRDLPVKTLVAAALIIFSGWHLAGAAASAPSVAAEERVRLGTGDQQALRSQAQLRQQMDTRTERELHQYRQGFGEQIAIKLREQPFWLLNMTISNIGETLPMMLIGMALLRTGFFANRWPRPLLLKLALAGGGIGLAATLAILAWVWPRGFPPHAMLAAVQSWAALPHLLMATTYAALLVLGTGRIEESFLGRRLSDAGRMAFSNYLGTTILMTAIFYGWGLGLIGQFGRFAQLGFVLLAWTLMLGWSGIWLRHFRQGPLEWAWRSLSEKRALRFRR